MVSNSMKPKCGNTYGNVERSLSVKAFWNV